MLAVADRFFFFFFFRNNNKNNEMLFDLGDRGHLPMFLKYTFIFFPLKLSDLVKTVTIVFGSVSQMTCNNWDKSKGKQ